MLFQKLLQKVIHDGNVRLIDSRGRIYDYGNGTGRRCTLKLHNRRLEWKLVLNPPLYLGEAYMDGEITLEEGTLRDFIALLARNYRSEEHTSELQSLLRISYAVFCLKTTKHNNNKTIYYTNYIH